MALHIQMSEEAEREYKRAKMRGMLSSFGAATALSLAFGLTLTFTVIYFATEQPAEFLAYVPPAENAAPRPVPTTPQLQSKAATPSNTVAPSVIVSTGAAPVAMAQIDFEMDDSTDDGLSIDIGIGMDAGLGELGEEGGGMGSSQPAGSALEGSFYDLKQTKSGSPTKIGKIDPSKQGRLFEEELYATVSAFYKSWSANALNRFYKAPTKLYASTFYVPRARSVLAPRAFQCADKVKPNAWVAVYRGKVKSPVTGKIRFIGTADNFIGVRFGGRVVLEAGYRLPGRWKKDDINAVRVSGGDGVAYRKRVKDGEDRDHKGYEFIKYPGFNMWNDEKQHQGGLAAGIPIPVKEGTVYPIEVSVMDDAGFMGYVLMWEDMTGNPVIKNGKLAAGKKAYLFRTNFSLPSKDELFGMLGDAAEKKDGKPVMDWGEFDQDSPIWVAVP